MWNSMKNALVVVALILMLPFPVKAQQDPLFSQYMFNQLAINPGAAGNEDMVNMAALIRQQWVGFEGAPSVTDFTIHAPFNLFGIPSGAGLSIINDKLGFDKNLSFNASYAYRLALGKGFLGMGFTMGIMNRALEPEWSIPDGPDFQPPSNDRLIPNNKESEVAFDLGIGAFYRNDKVFAGISTTHLNQPKIKFSTTEGSTFIKRHYYATAGYKIILPNPLFELTPSFFIQSDGSIIHFHVNGMLTYNKKVWGGVSYRPGEALVAMIGTELFNGIKVGYSYDYSTTSIHNYSSGSHEFMIGYSFSISVDRTSEKYKSVRFL
jgi:type IX secretion system PorP/SprF family membrane protein